ncbi:MAG: glycosyltransferase, partial [Candidatus Dormibacteria bacterium]
MTEAPPVRSGIACVVDRLATGLRELGDEVDVVTTADVGRFEFGEVRLTGLARHWPALRRRLAKYDVVHLHGPAPTFSDAFLTLWHTLPRHRRPALVYTHHSDIALPAAKPLCFLYNSIHRRLVRAANAVVVSTPSYRTSFEPFGPENVEVVPFGVEPNGHLPRRNGERLTVAFCGQLRPYKGVDVLIRAAAELPDVQFEIAGDGHQAAELHELADALGLKNVVFHGRISDEDRDLLLHRADVVALPSTTRAEAFGIVVLEGMAAGAVPIASNLDGVRDVAGRSGLLVTPGHVRS